MQLPYSTIIIINVTGRDELSPDFAFVTVAIFILLSLYSLSGSSVLPASNAPNKIPLQIDDVPSVTIKLLNLYLTIKNPLIQPIRHPTPIAIINIGITPNEKLFPSVTAIYAEVLQLKEMIHPHLYLQNSAMHIMRK